jgi:dynein heavy chain
MDAIRSFLDDEKVQYIAARVLSAFRLSQDRWEALLRDDESRNLLGQLTRDPKCRRLFIFVNAKNMLQASTGQLAKGKKALAVYKMRLVPHDNPKEFIRALAIVEIPKNPVSAIHKMLDSVYSPLSKCERHVAAFSKPVGADITATMSDITGGMYVVLGKSQGLTMLTIPPQDTLTAPRTPSVLHTFESLVNQWIEQIRGLVAAEFPESETFGPLEEIKFWRKRPKNLEVLKGQVDSEEVKIVIDTLRLPSQPFAIQFEAVAAEVADALNLATETDRSLIPLSSFLEQLDSLTSDMARLCETFQPIFHLLWLMYSRTRWYHSPRHICTLVRRVSDFFAAQFATAIDGGSLVSGDPTVALERLEESQAQLNQFTAAYIVFKERLLNQEGASSFTLNNQAVLPRFLNLCGRLEELNPIVQTIIEFNRFDKTEVGGIHGHILSPRFVTLLDEFHDVDSKLTGLEFDLLKVSDAQFSAVIKELNVAFLDVDIRAVAIAIWAIQDAASIVSLGQVLSGFNALLRRPFFIDEFQRQYPHIVSLFRNDVQALSITFHEGKGNPPQLQGVPATASSFIWCSG